jgi:hypothetical protein
LQKASRSKIEEEDSEYFSNYLRFASASSPGFTVTERIYMGDKVKQSRKIVIMSEPKSTAHFIPPADKVTQGDNPLGLMKTSVRSR